ncbi:MAG: hypothetical protein IPO14_07910 [Saprospiraceae bacterium]|nr:hypothetical protein [Saprospiraceae bacterium]
MTITDTNGCRLTDTVVILSPIGMTLSCGQVSPAVTIGGTEGVGVVTVQGGVAPYTVTWTGGGSGIQVVAGSYNISGLRGGTYGVIVRDANNCTISCSFIISNAACNLRDSSRIVMNISCAGLSDGSWQQWEQEE